MAEGHGENVGTNQVDQVEVDVHSSAAPFHTIVEIS
jgi:hypothetical protein